MVEFYTGSGPTPSVAGDAGATIFRQALQEWGLRQAGNSGMLSLVERNQHP
jgi:hypothetical protein